MMTRLLLRIGGITGAALLALLWASGQIGARWHNLPLSCDLRNHLDETRRDYLTEIPAPSGRLTLAAADDGLFVHDGAHTLYLQATPYDPEVWAKWSPTADQLAVITRCERLFADSPWYGTYITVLYDFSAGLEHYQTQVVPLQITHSNDFRGWSPDGRHFIVQSAQNIMTIWSVEPLTAIYRQSGRNWNEYWWTPDGEQIAYLLEEYDPVSGTSRGYTLYFNQVRAGKVAFFPLPLEYNACGSTSGGYWSPSSPVFVHAYTCGSENIYLDLYQTDIDGSLPISSSVFPLLAYRRDASTVPVRWQGDNLLYWEHPAEGAYAYQAYNLGSGSVTTRLMAERPPFFPIEIGDYGAQTIHTDNRVALYREYSDGTYGIDLARSDGTARAPFIARADDLGNPYWHVSGERVAAVYAEETDSGRVVRVAWVNADGSGYGEYVHPRYIDYQNLVWSADGTRLLLNAIHADLTFDVLLLDVTTGGVQTLMERIAMRGDTRADDPVAAFTFSWMDDGGLWHYGGFALDGSPVFHLRSGAYWLSYPRVFWSPDQRHVAVKLRTGLGEWLVVAARDTLRYRIVSYDLSGLGDPVWRGNHVVYFTQSKNFGPVQDVVYRVK